MKKVNHFLWAAALALVLSACTKPVPTPEDETKDPDTPDTPLVERPDDAIGDDSSMAALWLDKYADGKSLSSLSDVVWMRWLVDNVAQSQYNRSLKNGNTDCRLEIKTKDSMRYISEADGWCLTLADSLGFSPDYTLARYGMKFTSENTTIRVTSEKVTPYSQTREGYELYTTSWLNRYIANQSYLNQNGLKYLGKKIENDESILEGYSVSIYPIYGKDLPMPYYKIALVRPTGQWARFGFIILKSKTRDDFDRFDDILSDYKLIARYGTSKNYFPVQEPRPNPQWNEETAAYYNKLISQNYIDYGVFTYSMPADGESNWQTIHDGLAYERPRLEEAFGQPFDIMPTYTPLGWYGTLIDFPVSLAQEFAGGNGFNGKPVLQFTYQFTDNNNNVTTANTTNNVTPVFGIQRGKYDEQFKKLAMQIKAYGKPVLFRLNNEMNSDWTSYCGMMSLCDPEIFAENWRRLFDIFQACGVDNCIWIFNSNHISCPYSNWGEDLPYWPGNDYVQALGITYYEMGNATPFTSFKTAYTSVYNKNKTYFSQLPWIISEYACGSGGGTSGTPMRYAHEQAEWVKAMLEDFKAREEWIQPIKGGVWFSCNDVDAQGNSVNFLRLDESLTETLDNFKTGFANLKSQRQ